MAPKVVNGRVLVPISTISNELHSNVLWDAKKQSVIVNLDVLVSETEISRSDWIYGRNKILEFFVAFDNRDREKAQSLLDKDYTSNRFSRSELMPTGGLTENIVDYQFKDVAFINSKLTVLVQVVTKLSSDDLKIADWKFTISGPNAYSGKISSLQVLENTERPLSHYTVFPGLTIDNKDLGK